MKVSNMKQFYKKNKKVILIIISIILILLLGTWLYNYATDEYKLTIDERTWIDENVSSVLNVNVINDSNIFGSVGTGVFYDFIEDFEEQYNLKLNPVVYKYEETTDNLTFGIKTKVNKDDIVFSKDHYVLLSKNKELINNYEDFNEKNIGILAADEKRLSGYVNANYTTFETKQDLLNAFEQNIDYIVVPRYLYADSIISNNYNVIYHLSEVNYYYTLQTDDTVLSDVMYKYFNSNWKEEVYNSLKEQEFNLFVEKMSLSELEVDKFTSRNYTYGFAPNSPYEGLSSGSFGGISAVALREFSDFADIEFEFVKYKNIADLKEAINKKNVDIYLDKYNFDTEFLATNTGFNEEYSVIAPIDNEFVLNSITGLKGKTVYVEKNSKIKSYLNEIEGINIKTYESEKELISFNDEKYVVVLDANSFEYYNKNGLENYVNKLNIKTDFSVNYAVSTDDKLYELLNQFINLEDEAYYVNAGILNYHQTLSFGSLIASLAKYILFLLIIVIVIIVLFIKKTKKIHIAKKITKEDRLKYIDQLTSLKNRNYFNDQKESWDNNTIYPQTIIIVDLNKIQKLNDQYGYEEGDKQIQNFANSLIRTQLDNSDIMRTDGNEFVIYLVGYSQKQVVNYIHKLNKEVAKLPHQEGAKFGYSMILDNLKTIEDALNDAANDMIEKNKNEKKN